MVANKFQRIENQFFSAARWPLNIAITGTGFVFSSFFSCTSAWIEFTVSSNGVDNMVHQTLSPVSVSWL